MNIAITMDYDWASDEILEFALGPIIDSGVKITLFATHESEWVNSIRNSHREQLELEIHPNFQRGSSHGDTIKQVFETCGKLTSDKLGYRCHKYYNDNDVQEYFTMEGYKYSSNICTDLQYVAPFLTRTGLLEIPIYMEDGGFLYRKHSLSLHNALAPVKHVENGTIVFLFHPMHLAFNSNIFSTMRTLKQELTREQYQNITLSYAKKHRNERYGIFDLFKELLDWTECNSIEKVLMKEIHG